MRVLIAAPPRRYWPFTSEGDNYLLQQALPHLAAVLLHEGGVEVKVLDCMPLRMGWKTLAQEVRDFRPHIVAIGENHALYANEALRFVALAKEMVPAARIIVGGGHFASLHHVYLGKYSIDANVMGEVELLYKNYGKRAFVWVDESWNIDPRFSDAYADAVLKSGMKLKSMCFMRAECIIRDEERGILEKLVRAGLSHILIGVERAEDDDLTLLDKRFYRGGTAERAIRIMKERYPEVFIQAASMVRAVVFSAPET